MSSAAKPEGVWLCLPDYDEISEGRSGDIQIALRELEVKKPKGLTKENLRDNMSTLELVLNMLAEATTTELAKGHDAQGFAENQEIARRGGKVAGDARKAIEADTGKPVITSKNAVRLNQVVTDMIEGVTAEQIENAEPDKKD